MRTKYYSPFWRFAAGLVCAVFLTAHGAARGAKGKEAVSFHAERLGDIQDVTPYMVSRFSSRDGCHLALVAPGVAKGSMIVRCDGRTGPEYEGILSRTPVFSLNGSRMAYGARRGETWVVVVDGENPSPKWDLILENSLTFSEDGRHMAYVAKKGAEWFVVADGKASPPCQSVPSAPVFSKKGEHLAYGAERERRQFAVLDGQPGPAYDLVGGVTLSPDGEHLAYAAQQDGRQFVVADGRAGAPYGRIGVESLQFSPDGKHMVYFAEKGARKFVVNDGQEGPDLEGMMPGSLRVSPDSRRVACVVRKGEKFAVLVDGKEEPMYEKLDPPVFSEDGRHVAYVAGTMTGRLVVVDGQPGPEFEQILKDSLCFSADGSRCVYEGLKNGRCALMADGKPLGEYDALGTPSFSPDGKHLVCRAGRGEHVFVCIDGEEVSRYSDLVCEPVFRRDGVLEWLAIDNGGLFRVTSRAFAP
ncbi:MAG: hypothetical protein WCH57_08035 [Verrucomicrobiota bacterium]